MKKKIVNSLVFLGIILSLTGCNTAEHENTITEITENETKEEETEQNQTQPYIVYEEQVEKLIYPNDYEAWDFPAQEIVGNERTFYADGHLVNMPNYIGEWEELLGVEFTEIPDSYGDGLSNYDLSNVCVIDENRVQYIFKIDTESYEKKENQEEEFEQLRKTETIGFEMRYDAEGWQRNMSMKDYISLLPDKNIFTADFETVNNELASLYGVELETTEEGYSLYVDKFDKGFSIEWTCSQDGNTRHLMVDYTSNAYLAYYKFIKEEIPVYPWGLDDVAIPLKEVVYDEQPIQIRTGMIDVSDDGIKEMVVCTLYGTNVISYEKETGKIRIDEIDGLTGEITERGVLVENGYLGEDGNFDHYSPDDAIFIDTLYYILGEGGLEELVHIQECKKHNDYYINNKQATEEQVKECRIIYESNYISVEKHSIEDILEQIKAESKVIYEEIRAHKKLQEEHPIGFYDDSNLEEVKFDESKRPLLQLLLDMANRFVSLSDFLEADYCNETSAFSLMDLNGDGQQELLASLNSENGALSYPTIYVKNTEGNYAGIGQISGYIPETGELIVENGSAFASMSIYTFDGQALTKVMDLSSGENMEGSVYSYKEGDGTEIFISEQEFNTMWNKYKGMMKPVKGELLTIENIEKVLNVRICGNRHIFRDAN